MKNAEELNTLKEESEFFGPDPESKILKIEFWLNIRTNAKTV